MEREGKGMSGRQGWEGGTKRLDVSLSLSITTPSVH